MQAEKASRAKEFEELKLAQKRGQQLIESRDVEIQALMDKVQTLERQNKDVFMELDQSLCLNASNIYQTAGKEGSPHRDTPRENTKKEAPLPISSIAVKQNKVNNDSLREEFE